MDDCLFSRGIHVTSEDTLFTLLLGSTISKMYDIMIHVTVQVRTHAQVGLTLVRFPDPLGKWTFMSVGEPDYILSHFLHPVLNPPEGGL